MRYFVFLGRKEFDLALGTICIETNCKFNSRLLQSQSVWEWVDIFINVFIKAERSDKIMTKPSRSLTRLLCLHKYFGFLDQWWFTFYAYFYEYFFSTKRNSQLLCGTIFTRRPNNENIVKLEKRRMRRKLPLRLWHCRDVINFLSVRIILQRDLITSDSERDWRLTYW